MATATYLCRLNTMASLGRYKQRFLATFHDLVREGRRLLIPAFCSLDVKSYKCWVIL